MHYNTAYRRPLKFSMTNPPIPSTTDFNDSSIQDKYRTLPIPRYYVGTSALLNLIGDVQDKTVIDIGCGGGDITAAIHDRGASVIGIDRANGFLEKAKAEFPHVRFLEMDACAMTGIDAASADLAVMFMVTLSMTSRDMLSRLFSETARILKPGGHLVYGTVHPVSIGNLDEPIRRVRLPEGLGYCDSEIRVETDLLLCDNNWIHFSDCHWTMQDIVSHMVANQLYVTELKEPIVAREDIDKDPRLEVMAHRPYYLLLKARKFSS